MLKGITQRRLLQGLLLKTGHPVRMDEIYGCGLLSVLSSGFSRCRLAGIKIYAY